MAHRVSILLCILSMLAMLASGQTVMLGADSYASGTPVSFTILEQSVRGAESDLSNSSVPAAQNTITVGAAKAGVFPIRFKDGGGSVKARGFLVLVNNDQGVLQAQWVEVAAPQPRPELIEALDAYAAHLNTARFLDGTGPAITTYARSNPVGVASTFVICITPGFGAVCMVSVSDTIKSCGVEMLKVAADDMRDKGDLTPKQAELVKDLFDATDLLISVFLDGKALVLNTPGNLKLQKMAKLCEELASFAGSLNESTKNPDIKGGIKMFLDLIKQTCIVIDHPLR